MSNPKSARAAVGVVFAGGVLAGMLAAPAARAADSVTVGTVSGAPGAVVNVPIDIRDASGTPLGIDQPPGSRIQSYSIRVTYAPAAAVQSISFSRAGITQPLTPAFESSPASPGSISLIDTFQESTNLIPFTLNAALPGNQVAHLLITLAPSAAPGTVITLTLDPVLTQLTDQAGDAATAETVANAQLTLTNGAVNVIAAAPAVPMASPIVLLVLAIGLAFVGMRVTRS
jgi:hypothetical protein